MDLNANSISKIEATKTAFEKAFKENLINDCFRNIVTKSIPLKEGEREKIDNPEFRDKFTAVLSGISKDMVDSFDHVGQFDTGNLFTSMVNSISESVSLESDYRQQKLINQIRLGKVGQDHVSLNIACEKAFTNTKSFESQDISKRFSQDMKYLMSVEDVNDVVERIKNDVKDAIEETEAKNELVEGTTQEIIDYKNEIAPPDDEYQDPENPDAGDMSATGDDTGDANDALADTSDDGLAGNTDDSQDDEQLYDDDTGDGLGTDQTFTGDNDMDNTEAPADPSIGGDDGVVDEGDVGKDNGEGGEIGEGDVGENTDDVTSDGTDAGLDDTGDDTADMGDDGLGDTDDTANTDAGLDGATDDLGGDTPQADTGSAGNTNNNSGGITININGASLGKENLNLYNARSLSEKRIPLHPRTFESMELPDVNTLSSECVNAVGDVKREMKMRLDGLKLATKQAHGISEESQSVINEKISQYGTVIAEALSNANSFNKTLNDIGLTPQGLIRANENTFAIARNIIDRFVYRRKHVSPEVRPYTSKENIYANAFDIVQLRQYCDKHDNPSETIINDLESRENVFYHNMLNYNDENVKKEAYGIIDLSKMNFQKAISPNFITDYKIKVWEENIGDKSNIEVNAEVVKRVKDKFEKLWCRDLNDDEVSIIKAITNQEDVTDIVPTPYEKFIVTMSKEAILAHGCEDGINGVSLSKEEKKDIEWKSRLMTTVYKTAEAFGLFDKVHEDDNLNKFMNKIGL